MFMKRSARSKAEVLYDGHKVENLKWDLTLFATCLLLLILLLVSEVRYRSQLLVDLTFALSCRR